MLYIYIYLYITLIKAMNNITDPLNGNTYSIFSQNGKSLLKKYVSLYQKHGGAEEGVQEPRWWTVNRDKVAEPFKNLKEILKEDTHYKLKKVYDDIYEMYKNLPEREGILTINKILEELEQKKSEWERELDEEKRNDAVNIYIEKKIALIGGDDGSDDEQTASYGSDDDTDEDESSDGEQTESYGSDDNTDEDE